MYIWEHPDWPTFRWSAARLQSLLSEAHFKHGRLLGAVGRLGFDVRLRAEAGAITEQAIKTSEIEGEVLDAASVRSSVARRLGLPDADPSRQDRRADGVVDITLDATKNFARPLSRERLFTWHAALFPAGYSGLDPVRVGAWRDDAKGPMQVLSGPYGRERVHFEAPSAARIDAEMAAFLDWFNATSAIDGILHAALAHLWFVTIHPFDDGNGRIARTIADMSLARAEGSSQRFYSLAGQIRKERSDYYATLETAQKGDLDVTDHLAWFVGCFTRAIEAAENTLAGTLRTADFWQRHALVAFNERQRRVLNRILYGFEGKLTARKWTTLAKCSTATAQRDINELVDRGVLVRNPGGSKNTSYAITSDNP
ncbi:MAG: Fic family protein [Rhodospirillaceae bacterium]|nr:Fic family protein [Rhodospirillaceae bacterium]